MHAIREILLSVPNFCTRSVKSPIEPPPDRGRRIARGRISGGISKHLKSGESSFAALSTAPDSVSIAETDKIATNAGKIDMAVFKPFSTPSKKASYTLILFFRAYMSKNTIKNGKIKAIFSSSLQGGTVAPPQKVRTKAKLMS